jgi:hypothetical protein
MDEKIQLISLRAYEIWEQEGRPDGRAIEHWIEAERQIGRPDGTDSASPDANEGEGNRTAARVYNRQTEAFARSGQVGPQARAAADALDGPEAAALRRAEEVGRQHSHGEDPALAG